MISAAVMGLALLVGAERQDTLDYLHSCASTGDLYVYNSAGDGICLAVGADATVLAADSSEAAGVKWTTMLDLPSTAEAQRAVGVTDVTTTSSTYTVIPGMTLTETTQATGVIMVYTATHQHSQNSIDSDFAFFVDGVLEKEVRWNIQKSNQAHVVTITALVFVAAGSHDFDVRWLTLSGTLKQLGTSGFERQFFIVEF